MTLHLDASALLGLAYACTLAAIPLWAWKRTRNLTGGLVWAAATLLAGYLAVQFAMGQRPLFTTLGDFLIACALGILLSVGVWKRASAAGFAVPLAMALAALGWPVLRPPVAAPAPVAQTTALYAVQAALHALGVGGLLAAMPGWYADGAGPRAWKSRELGGLAALGLGLALSSAWAWLNWGLVWRSEPRLNLLAGGWLLLMAGHHAQNAGRNLLAKTWKTLAIGIALFAVLGAELCAGWWGYLPLLAW